MVVLHRYAAALVLLALLAPRAAAWRVHKDDVERLNRQLHGRLLDYTHNHGVDRRIWSSALCQKRDVYVYLPPGYDGVKQFPLFIFMHGLAQDETLMIRAIDQFDDAIVRGCFPPCVIVIPDGSLKGHKGVFGGGSFYLNTKAGRFEDYMMQDVYPFLMANFAVRPEKEAHVLCGASMGGFSAFNLAIKHPNEFQVATGILPLLNLRYCDCHGDRFGEYDPDCIGWLEGYHPRAVVGKVKGVIPGREFKIRERQVLSRIFNAETLQAELSRENPVEMLDFYDLKPGDVKFFVTYTPQDDFKADAQAKSFIAVAERRGIPVDIGVVDGRHNMTTGAKLLPQLGAWLNVQLAPFVPH